MPCCYFCNLQKLHQEQQQHSAHSHCFHFSIPLHCWAIYLHTKLPVEFFQLISFWKRNISESINSQEFPTFIWKYLLFDKNLNINRIYQFPNATSTKPFGLPPLQSIHKGTSHPTVCKEQGGSSCWHFMGQKQSGASPGEGLGLLPPVSGFTLSNPGKYSKSEDFPCSPTLKTFSGGFINFATNTAGYRAEVLCTGTFKSVTLSGMHAHYLCIAKHPFGPVQKSPLIKRNVKVRERRTIPAVHA